MKLSELEIIPGFNKTASALIRDNNLNITTHEEFERLFPDQVRPINNYIDFFEPIPVLKNTMEFALEIEKHDRDKAICVLGDYDADGILATVIMVHTLKLLGFTVYFNIPDRLNDGYGDQEKYLEDFINNKNVGLFITVDNGICGKKLAKTITDLGAKLIITDHHLPNEDTPENILIIDPKYNNDEFTDISGATVALKLCYNLCKYYGYQIDWLLVPLAGITVVSDMMPMLKENRYLMNLTLQQMDYDKSLYHSSNKITTKLIKILFALNGKNYILDKNSVATEDVLGFLVGPCVNAVSRVNGSVAELVIALLKVLSCPNGGVIKSFSEINETRKNNTKTLNEDLNSDDVEYNYKDNNVILLSIDQTKYDFNVVGIKGLTANQLVSRYNKPALVGLATDDGISDFSGRSVPGYNLHDAVFDRIAVNHPEFEITGGGHASALGVKFKTEYLEQFQQALNEDFEAYAQTKKKIVYEFEPEMVDEVIETCRSLKPYGQGFHKLKFAYSGILKSYDYDNKKAVLEDDTGFTITMKLYLKKETWSEKIGTRYTRIITPCFEDPDVEFCNTKD